MSTIKLSNNSLILNQNFTNLKLKDLGPQITQSNKNKNMMIKGEKKITSN